MRRSFVWLIFILAVSLPFYPSFSNAATKKALLVGINTYEKLPFYSNLLGRQVTNLKGSVNDVNSMKRLLISQYGFRAEDVQVLTNSQATRNAILNAFERWLIHGTKEGDLAFFYFSGHGTQIPDQNGDEDDGMDEALCPYDLVPVGAGRAVESRVILDDEMGVLLRRLKGREVVVFVDACHSGSMTRSIGGAAVSRLEETPAATPKYMPVELAQSRVRGKSLPSGIPRQNDIPGEQIFISSSRENQVSLEIALDEGFHGAMTSAVVEGMARKADMTYVELYEYARKVIKDRHRLEQDAQMEPERGKVLENRVFVSRYEMPPKMKQETPKTGPAGQAPQAPQAKEHPTTTVKTMPSPYSTSSGDRKPGSAAVEPSPVLKGEKVLLRIDPLKGAGPDLMKELEDGVKRLNFVEMSEPGFFDRLIRGELRDGQFYVRLLNRAGDVETLPPGANREALIGFIRPRLERVYIEKQLARISNPSPPFRVKLWVTDDRRRDFRIGEKVVFNFSSEKDCYLYLLNVDRQGDFQILFPNPLHRGNFVRAGLEKKIPDETAGEMFEFVFREPAGEEMIKAIATLEPLELEELEIEGDKKTFAASDVGTLRVKKIEEILASREFLWSEDTVVIRSHLVQ
jgi:hypothetical protein